MKRWICILILLGLLASMAGCGYSSGSFKDPVYFYYTRYEKDYLYGDVSAVIVAEEREAAGHSGHIDYLVVLYLSGSLDESLTSPFPAGTVLQKVEQNGATLLVELNANPSLMKDHDFTLACTCLALTCLEISDAEEITIVSADKSATIGRDDLTLYDDVIIQSQE